MRQDVRKLGQLADAIPRDFAQTFILFSKTGVFSPDEIALAKGLNTDHQHRVILWSSDELEPYFLYERAKAKLGQETHAISLVDMVNVTRRLYFADGPRSGLDNLKIGAGEGIRTLDPDLGKVVLYP